MIYLPNEYFGGIYDVKKTTSSTEDDLMCWAAAASNILAWSKWGILPSKGLINSISIFQYFQDHWTDSFGYINKAWEWWFNGIDDPHIDVPGGGFWNCPYYAFNDNFLQETNRSNALSAIDEFLHNGWGVALNLTAPGGGHCLTCWGFEVNDTGDYTAIYVTDSDDPLNNQYRLYQLSQNGWAGYPDWWYITYHDSKTQYLIANVYALKQRNDNIDVKPPSPPSDIRIKPN